MPRMNDSVLTSVLNSAVADSTAYDATFMQENEYLLERYLGMPYGDEKPERSKVISNDVQDIVEADMPSLTRIFLGSGQVMKFEPNRPSNPQDVKEADQKTKYVDWQVRKQPWSFRTLFGWMKNAEIHKASVVKYYIEENTEVEEHQKHGLSPEEITLFMESLQGENVQRVEIVERGEETYDGLSVRMDVKFRVEMTRKCVKIRNIPLERFVITRNAEDKNDATVCGDIDYVTRGELVARGYSRKVVDKLPLANEYNAPNSRLNDIRDADEGGANGGSDTSLEGYSGTDDWSMEVVELQDLYITVDYDGDGIAERRRILRSGTDPDGILENEVYNHVPYAILSSVMMPHKAIGRSRAEITAPTARIKTAILRGVQDNIYAVNAPRIAANKNVNYDDLLNQRPNGVIRTKKDTPVGNDLFAVQVPYIGDKALQVLQYWDQARAQSTGSLMASQGLEADDLGKETATRFTGIQDASEAKVELVARTMAEGWKELYEGIAWLDANYQDTETEIAVLGEELIVNPSDWKYTHYATSQVGLGIGDDEKLISSMSALLSLHQQLQASGSPLTDQVKIYNIASRIVKGLGLHDPGEFFNNPEQPEQLLMAENAILKQAVQQLQQQVQNNPLAEVEQVRAQAKLIEAQGKAQIDVAKLQEEQRQFNAKMMQEQENKAAELLQKQEEKNKELAFKLTELESRVNQQLNAEMRQNTESLSEAES